MKEADMTPESGFMVSSRCRISSFVMVATLTFQ